MADSTKKAAAESAGKDVSAPRLRGGLVQFIRDVRREGSKVTWPSWKETWLTTVMVFIMVGITMMFFFVVDMLLEIGSRWMLGAL